MRVCTWSVTHRRPISDPVGHTRAHAWVASTSPTPNFNTLSHCVRAVWAVRAGSMIRASARFGPCAPVRILFSIKHRETTTFLHIPHTHHPQPTRKSPFHHAHRRQYVAIDGSVFDCARAVSFDFACGDCSCLFLVSLNVRVSRLW